MNRSIIIAAALISAAILLDGFLHRRADLSTVVSGPAETTATLTRTVAVLPFTSLDSAEANELLPAGLQREIVTRLTAQRVKAALASDSPSTGEALLGSVQRAGHQVRVNVQLVHAGSRKPRWAQTYDRDVTDVLAFESEIAESVAKAIAAKKM